MTEKTCCIHVVDIGGYFPELTEYTLPTIESFASRIGAKLNVITERRFPDQDVVAEKLQVHEAGVEFDRNILLDLDILVHPRCYDPFRSNIPPTHVAFKDNYDAATQLMPDQYFLRDGRNVGISGCAVFTTRMTHDLWKPITDLTIEEIDANILQERKVVDEYTLSRNLAKYGLRYVGPYQPTEYDYLFHLGAYGRDKNEMIDKAKLWHKMIWERSR